MSKYASRKVCIVSTEAKVEIPHTEDQQFLTIDITRFDQSCALDPSTQKMFRALLSSLLYANAGRALQHRSDYVLTINDRPENLVLECDVGISSSTISRFQVGNLLIELSIRRAGDRKKLGTALLRGPLCMPEKLSKRALEQYLTELLADQEQRIGILMDDIFSQSIFETL